jgi:parallel beta-helix repeat protein
VVNNNCSNNNNFGILLENSDSSTVEKNTCNNNWHGIDLYKSDFCNITYNLLQENERYGIDTSSDSDNNNIHHNNFADNNLVGGTSQARDEGTNNYWYDTEILEGNYWSDWSGIGSYSIDGPASSVDLFPLDEPTLLPIIAEYQLLSLFTLLIPVVPLLTIIFSRRRRKTA